MSGLPFSYDTEEINMYSIYSTVLNSFCFKYHNIIPFGLFDLID